MGKNWFDWKGKSLRVAFAFDPRRRAILLAGGDKAGVDQRRFYRKLISIADERFDAHLEAMGFKKGRQGRKGADHGEKS